MKLKLILLMFVMILCLSSFVNAITDIDQYVVGAFLMDETSGTTAIDSSGNFNSTLTATTVNQAGVNGQAYLFDGSDGTASFMSISEDDSYDFGTSDFTIMGWFKPRAKEQNYPTILSSGCGDVWSAGCFIMRHSHDAELNQVSIFHFDHAGYQIYSTPNQYALNTWHFFVYLKRSGVIELWINGVSKHNETEALYYDFSINSAGV